MLTLVSARLDAETGGLISYPEISAVPSAVFVDDNIEACTSFLSRGVFSLTKKTKKDGSTKQKGNKSNPKQKTSSSANGSNGYH